MILTSEDQLSQHQLRAELESMVIKDLLGPAGGDSEEITERTVRDRYLVGILSPSRKPTESEANSDDLEEEDEIPSIPDELSEDGSDSIEDGTTDKDTPVTRAFFPSSIGLTFCVELSTPKLRIEATWGHYKREKREEQTS